MKTSKSIMSIAIVLVFGILINWYCFSDDSHAAQAQKAPAATQPMATQPAGTQPMTKQPETKGLQIEGRAMYGARGMKGVEITLTEYFSNGRVGIAGKKMTDRQGAYKFALLWNDNIVKYKIVPKHPLLAPGDYFSPQEKIFPRPSATTKIDFAYTGPLPDLVIQNGPEIIKNEGRLAAGPFEVWVSFHCFMGLQGGCDKSATVSLPGMAAGYAVEVPLPSCTCGSTPIPGSRTIKAIAVDKSDVVFESNEDNNAKDYGTPGPSGPSPGPLD